MGEAGIIIEIIIGIIFILALIIVYIVLLWYVSKYTAILLKTETLLIFLIWIFFPPIGIIITLFTIFMNLENQNNFENINQYQDKKR
jgi:predicted membrane protein